ncbi:MAG TPA: hypothetical protein DEF34_03650 [Desulfotomaculum sp.]|nr:hypothetical protein [Desulfotomaculum sp.]
MLKKKFNKKLSLLLTPLLFVTLVFGILMPPAAFASERDFSIEKITSAYEFPVFEFPDHQFPFEKRDRPNEVSTMSFGMMSVTEAETESVTRYVYQGWSDGNVEDDELTWDVNAFNSVNDAASAANPGDTIYVYDGTYDERVYIYTENITLQAQSNSAVLTCTKLEEYGAVVEVLAPGVTIEGFTITAGEGADAGIYIWDEVPMLKTVSPINTDEDPELDTVICDNDINTVEDPDSRLFVGIAVESVTGGNLTVENNDVLGFFAYGIAIPYEIDNTVNITDNTVNGSDYGIWLGGLLGGLNEANVVTPNMIIDEEEYVSTANITIEDNAVTGPGEYGFGECGIFSYGLYQGSIVVKDNDVSGNYLHGIAMPIAIDVVTITGNEVNDAEFGIVAGDSRMRARTAEITIDREYIETADITIEDNTVTGPGELGISLPSLTQGSIVIDNNTIYDCVFGIMNGGIVGPKIKTDINNATLVNDVMTLKVTNNNIILNDNDSDQDYFGGLFMNNLGGAATISDNAVHCLGENNYIVGILAGYYGYPGADSEFYLLDNSVSACGIGIGVQGSIENGLASVTGNQVTDCLGFGFVIEGLDAAFKFAGNVITGTTSDMRDWGDFGDLGDWGSGVLISYASGDEMVKEIGPGNVITDNAGGGIYVSSDASDLQIFRNTLARNGEGIVIEGSNNEIWGNWIADSLQPTSGIHLSDSSNGGNIINFNSLSGNGVGISSDVANEDATLNWWNDAAGPGHDGDSISGFASASLLYEPWITGAALTADNANLQVKDTVHLDLTAYLSDERSVSATVYATNFTSDNPSVATVTNDGLVTAKSVGTATITALFADCPTIKINVTAPSRGGGSGNSNKTRAKIDASSGGTVSFKNVIVEVPGSTLPEDAYISIEKLSSGNGNNDPADSGFKLLGNVYEINTTGSSNFGAQTLTISIAYDPLDLADGEVPVIYWFDGETWVPLETTLEQDEKTGQWYAVVVVNHLTQFAVLAVEPAAKKVIQLTIGSLDASVDGNAYTMDAVPFVETDSNRTLVPIRFVSEALGAEVEWVQEDKQVIINDGVKQITLTLGSVQVMVDGQPVTIDCAPVVVNPGRTFVPLRFISETLGATVDYQEDKQIVIER